MTELTLPWPPSVNSYYRSPTWGPLKGRTLISEHGRKYRMAVAQMAQTEKWPAFGTARLQIHIEAWMPDKRRRDLDNVLKATLDSLTHAGVWGDDSQIDKLTIERMPWVGGMLKVRIGAVNSERVTW